MFTPAERAQLHRALMPTPAELELAFDHDIDRHTPAELRNRENFHAMWAVIFQWSMNVPPEFDAVEHSPLVLATAHSQEWIDTHRRQLCI
jgi:hypothetical protein